MHDVPHWPLSFQGGTPLSTWVVCSPGSIHPSHIEHFMSEPPFPILLPMKLEISHLATALDDPGGLGRWISNDSFPFAHGRRFSPHRRRGVRGRLISSPAKHMNAIPPDSQAFGVGGLCHASTSIGTPTVSCHKIPCRSSLQMGTALTMRCRLNRCQRCKRASIAQRALRESAVT